MTGKCSCRKAFTDVLLEEGRKNADILALATDSGGSVTLGGFMNELPEQYVELGIAEQNAVAVGAGLATAGNTVFVCGPACFLAARAFEQVKVDVAYNKSNVKILGVSAGVSYGPLGGTHTSLHDLASMRALPNIEIFAPSDAVATRFVARYLCEHKGPAYIRIGRGDVNAIYEDDESFDVNDAKCVRDGTDMTIIACGEAVYPALVAAEQLQTDGISARVLDYLCIKPLDEGAIIRAAGETGAILTVEEHSINGGLGEAVAHVVCKCCPVPMDFIGFPDKEVAVGSSAQLFDEYGISSVDIAAAAKRLLQRK